MIMPCTPLETLGAGFGLVGVCCAVAVVATTNPAISKAALYAEYRIMLPLRQSFRGNPGAVGATRLLKPEHLPKQYTAFFKKIIACVNIEIRSHTKPAYPNSSRSKKIT